jgi:hypothetical protein
VAVVLSHVHFCPACDGLWACVQWRCQHDEWDEFLCKDCHEGKEIASAGCAGADQRAPTIEESPYTQWPPRPFVRFIKRIVIFSP